MIVERFNKIKSNISKLRPSKPVNIIAIIFTGFEGLNLLILDFILLNLSTIIVIMFILKKKYFFIIESIKDIELKNIKNFGKFSIIYRNKIPENINKLKKIGRAHV